MKKSVLVLFGGESSEHEVSLKSSYNVINAISKEKYNIYAVSISKNGSWNLYEGDFEKIKDGSYVNEELKEAFVSPSKSKSGIVVLEGDCYKFIKIDVCFPVLHGKNGEDGTIQGLLTLSGIPYVGCKCTASAVCMDKEFTKIILENRKIPQTPYVCIRKNDNIELKTAEIEEKLAYPVFVKPVNAGSSVGAAKASDHEELVKNIKNAFIHDDKVLVEKYINCREIEVAVLGNSSVSIAGPGEIISDSEFYDYDTKYITNDGVTYSIPADISNKTTEKIREYAKTAFEILDIRGLSRIDFFIDRETEEIYLNEINTIPGFTNISMYPKLFISEGLSYEQLVSELLELASR